MTIEKKLSIIKSMKKYLELIGMVFSYISIAGPAFAQTPINIVPPTQAVPTATPIQNIAQFLVSLLFVIGIVIAVAFLIYGGIKWVLSGGDKSAVESARNHIVAAIVGLVIVLSAFFILNIVFTILIGKPFDLSHLCIPSLSQPNC